MGMMHDMFVAGVLTWQTGKDGSHKAENWDKLLKHLSMDAATSPGQQIITVTEKLRGECFDFSAFLALNVETAVEDAVELHISSWIVVWIFLAVSFPLHCFLHVDFSSVSCLLLFPTAAWLILCLIVLGRMQTKLADRSRKMRGDS